MVVVSKLPWRRCLAFLLSALLPSACYAAIAMAAHASCASSHSFGRTFLPAAILLLLLLVVLCRLSRKSFCAHAPAYATVLGHFLTAVLTHLVKLLPVVSAGLSTMFLGVSLVLSFLLARMISSDPGCMATSSEKIDGPWREGKSIDDTNNCFDLKISCNSIYKHAYTLVCTWENNGPAAFLIIIHVVFACCQDLIKKGGEKTHMWRGKYCHRCHAFIERYDHHCAAVENCIGRKNHGVFLVLLVAFILAEILYLSCCISYLRPFSSSTPQIKKKADNNLSFKGFLYAAWEIFCREAWVLSTAFFIGFQILWQIPLLIFQTYLIVNNLTTDEWVNWENYSRFCKQGSRSHGSPYQRKEFVNPYDQGFMSNLHAMLQNWKQSAMEYHLESTPSNSDSCER